MRSSVCIQKLLAVLLVLSTLWAASACDNTPGETDGPTAATPASVLEESADILLQTVTEPSVNSAFGEWAVLGLVRWGGTLPEGWTEGYYSRVEEYTGACGGVLHDKKYTEYSRVILALTAIGKDPTDVAGYDLTLPLADYEKTVYQGNHGAAWALIALDSGNWPLPENSGAVTQATRELYVRHLLEHQQEDGGWCMNGVNSGTPSDPDITSMALQALANYQSEPAVAAAVIRALSWLSGQQESFSSAETNAQLLVALCELGISIEDARFVKDGKTVVDELLTYYRPGEGFTHQKDTEEADQIATEQAFYALVAWHRVEQGQASLYDMAGM